MNEKRILLLGSTGKLGTAINQVFSPTYEIIGLNTKSFDASNFPQTEEVIRKNKPAIVINAVALMGIDHCEREYSSALLINTLFPKLLAQLSTECNFLLIHFSTESVFHNRERTTGYFYESDSASPINVYGLTKFGGDCFVQSISERYYLIRTPILFGGSTRKDQFVEKMVDRIRQSETTLHIAGDIFSSPTYSIDVAQRVKSLVEIQRDFGLYHVANDGIASLYDLVSAIAGNVGAEIEIVNVSFRDFSFTGQKNTYTPISSERLSKLRHWKEAVTSYCETLKTTDT